MRLVEIIISKGQAKEAGTFRSANILGAQPLGFLVDVLQPPVSVFRSGKMDKLYQKTN